MTLGAASREGVPPLSAQTWVDAMAVRGLDRALPLILATAAAAEPLCVFLSGSAVHGELCAIRTPGGVAVYLSDIDLGVLTRGEVPGHERDRLSERLAGIEGPPLRVGFYRLTDARGTHPTPGLADAVHRAIVLHGDPKALDSFRAPEPARVPRGEGARLLGNRVVEWLETRTDSASPIERVYATAKLHADAGAAALLMTGMYRVGGYAQRASALAGVPMPDSLRQRILRWTRWRLDPTWDSTPQGGGVDAAAADPAVEGGVIATVTDTIAVTHPGPDVKSYFARVPVGFRSRARAWKRHLRARGPSGPRVRLADLRMTPRQILVTAVVLCLMRNTEGAKIGGRLFADARSLDREGMVRLLIRWIRTMDREGID